MAEPEKVEREKITVTNPRPGPYIVVDVDGKSHVIGRGQEVELEVPKPEAERMKKASEAGHGLTVKGAEPKEEKDETAVEEPEEHDSRTALAKKEAEVMKAGQEGDKEARAKLNKMDRNKLAARTGIHNMAFYGPDALETVGAPPDAPEEKPAKK